MISPPVAFGRVRMVFATAGDTMNAEGMPFAASIIRRSSEAVVKENVAPLVVGILGVFRMPSGYASTPGPLGMLLAADRPKQG